MNATPRSTSDIFFFGTSFANILTLTTVSKNIVLGDDSEFDLLGYTAWTSEDALATGNTQGQFPNNFSVLITNTTTGRQMMSESVKRGIICGIAYTNFVREGKVIRYPRKEQFEIQITSLSASTITSLQFMMKGYKVFQNSPPMVR